MDSSEGNGRDIKMGERIKRLLEEAEAWCRASGKRSGRMTELAEYVGVEISHVSMWFSEARAVAQGKKKESGREPTGEQALALEAFINYQRGKKPSPEQ